MLLVALPLFSLTLWQYIETYTQHRSRDPARDDIVRKIDNIRNGTLLNKALSRHLNFAMSTTDVDPTAQLREKRCVAHLFYPDRPDSFGNPRFPVSIRDLQSGCLLLLTSGLLIFSLTE
jgi:hypothetical protein